MTTPVPPVLAARSISKSFPGVRALTEVSISVGPGECVAVVGENGAGKSTLMKILAGVQSPDAGNVLIDGQHVQFRSLQDSLRAGVVLIHQELNLAQHLSVEANLLLGREPQRWGLIDHAELRRQAVTILQRVGLGISPETPAGQLSIAQQQLVEIGKALSVRAKVLIFDEPTSSLSLTETRQLFQLIRELQSQGIGILYISHRLPEICELAYRVVVLRDGRHVGERMRGEFTQHDLIPLMIGRDFKQQFPPSKGIAGDIVLQARGFTTSAYPEARIDLHLRRGEIVGLAGLVGAGRTELLETLFGVTPAISGELEINGQPAQVRNCREAIRHGLALVPEDRKARGLVLPMGVTENLSLPELFSQRSKRIFRNPARENSVAVETIARLRVKTPTASQPVRLLSGGNQQKVVLGKWLPLQPHVLLLDEPTRGIDVGAKREIYELMRTLAAEGLAILFASSELEEILGLADRVLVLHEGRLAGELSRDQLSEQAIMHLATGFMVTSQ